MKLPFLTRVAMAAADPGLAGVYDGQLGLRWAERRATLCCGGALGEYPGYVTALVCVVFMGTSIFLYHNRQAFSLARVAITTSL